MGKQAGKQPRGPVAAAPPAADPEDAAAEASEVPPGQPSPDGVGER